MKKHIILFIAIFFASVLHAQTINIRGTVTDTSNETLPGVSITIKGTQTGTVSDANGNYSIRAQRGNVLEFTFVGMVKQSVTVGKQNVINIQMAADAINLDEVVAIGYGIAKKSDLTGAVASIKSENLTNSKVGTVTTALQGLAAGVQVTTGSVKPGGDASVVIRGVGSLRAGSEPLYIVDGIPVQGGLQDLSSGDIESIEILKDASSASIYGSRGSNGVVLVTTKKGTSGKAKISLNASFGTQRMLNKQDLMNAQQYYELVSIAQPNYKWTSEELRLLSRGESTDWQDAVTQNGQYQNYNFSISGGKNDIQHFLGVDWYDQKGTIKNSSFNKLTVRYNMDAKLNKWLRYGVRFNVIESKLMNINEEADSGYGTMFSAISSQPTAPIYTEDGEYFDGFLNTRANPVAIVDLLDKATLKSRFVGSAYIEIEPIKNLKLRSDNGGELVFYKVNTYEDGRMGQHYTAGGHANVMSNKKRYWQTENTATYSFDINKEHQLSAMAGFSASRTDYEEVTADSKKLSSILKYYNLQGAEEHGPNSSYAVPSSLVSFYGRFNYNFSNRYLATLTMRGDGSSRFAPGHRWGFFPSLALAWRASEEEFIKKFDFISNLRVRTSFGMTGNNQIPSYQSLSQLENNKVVMNGSTVEIGRYPSNVTNDDLKWESQKQYNIGFDFGVLDNRFSITADFYYKRIDDMLLQVNIPSTSGYTKAWKNAGSMENKGMEFAINANWFKGAFNWSTDFNISFYKNKILSLDKGQYQQFYDRGINAKITSDVLLRVGMPVGIYYGYISDGTYNNDTEVINGYPGPNLGLGQLKVVDVNKDGVIDSNDRTPIADVNPKHTGGIGNTFSYKGFDLYAFFRWSYGNDVVNGNAYYLVGTTSINNVLKSVYKDVWSANTPTNNYPLYGRGTWGESVLRSDLVEDGSFLRLQTLTLGYTFPAKLTGKMGLSKMRIALTGTNLWLWSRYSGFDPEANTGYGTVARLAPGLDMSPYPRPRSFSLSIELGF